MGATINGAPVGGSGASAPSGSGVVEVASGAFVSPARSATLVRGALTVSSDPMSGTGWSALPPDAGATATWGGGILALAIAANTTAATGAPVAGAVGVGGDDYDFAARVEYAVGNGATQATASLTSGSDASNYASFGAYADGTLSYGYLLAGAWTTLGTASGPSSGQRSGGQLWLRISRRSGALVFAWGVGVSGALPTAWTVAGAYATAASLTASAGTYRVLQATCYSGATIPAGFLVNVRAITYQALGGL